LLRRRRTQHHHQALNPAERVTDIHAVTDSITSSASDSRLQCGWQRHRDARERHESKQIPSPEKSKRRRCPFAFRSSRLVFHPRRIVSSSTAEIALGENLTLLNRYVLGRIMLAVIIAAGHTFFACFSFHLGSPHFLRSSRTSRHLVVFWGHKSSLSRSKSVNRRFQRFRTSQPLTERCDSCLRLSRQCDRDTRAQGRFQRVVTCSSISFPIP
jgi:hypothetical protein